MWQSIVAMFSSLTPMLWVSQICGILGFIVITVSYQFKKEKFLLISGISYLLFVLEVFFAALYANAIVAGMSFVRNAIMIFYLTKKKKDMPVYWVFILLAAVWAAEFIYFALDGQALYNWENYLPPTLVTVYTLAANHKNYYVLKAGAFVHEVGYLAYYSINALPFSAIRQMILVISILVSVARMIYADARKHKEKKNAES